MPVSTQHEQYETNSDVWSRCRDCFNGGDAVKEAGSKYLPVLEGQTSAEYDAYRGRALFYNATARTVNGLLGAVFRQAPAVQAPEVLAELLNDVTLTGMPFEIFAKAVLREVLTVGRHGVLVDMPQEGSEQKRPYFVGYAAEQIVNWRTTRVNGDEVLSLVVLHEMAEEDDPSDPFVIKKIEQYRVLELEAIGGGSRFKTSIWRKVAGSEDKWEVHEELLPQRIGEALDYIPFCFIGPNDITTEVDRSPIVDLADVNLSHYRSSADLEHGRHFTALPTPWISGFPEDTVLRIGSSTAWVSNNPDAKAGMLEFTGHGLKALETALEEKEKKMAAIGARLLEDQKNSAEAARTVSLRQAGEQSLLKSIAITTGLGLTQCLQWAAEWIRVNGEVSVRLNTDYYEMMIEPANLEALMHLWQGGGISHETLYANLKRGEITRPGIEAEGERKTIEAEARLIAVPDDEQGEM